MGILLETQLLRYQMVHKVKFDGKLCAFISDKVSHVVPYHCIGCLLEVPYWDVSVTPPSYGVILLEKICFGHHQEVQFNVTRQQLVA